VRKGSGFVTTADPWRCLSNRPIEIECLSFTSL